MPATGHRASAALAARPVSLKVLLAKHLRARRFAHLVNSTALIVSNRTPDADVAKVVFQFARDVIALYAQACAEM